MHEALSLLTINMGSKSGSGIVIEVPMLVLDAFPSDEMQPAWRVQSSKPLS
jgi:hypothetical protein